MGGRGVPETHRRDAGEKRPFDVGDGVQIVVVEAQQENEDDALRGGGQLSACGPSGFPGQSQRGTHPDYPGQGKTQEESPAILSPGQNGLEQAVHMRLDVVHGLAQPERGGRADGEIRDQRRDRRRPDAMGWVGT